MGRRRRSKGGDQEAEARRPGWSEGGQDEGVETRRGRPRWRRKQERETVREKQTRRRLELEAERWQRWQKKGAAGGTDRTRARQSPVASAPSSSSPSSPPESDSGSCSRACPCSCRHPTRPPATSRRAPCGERSSGRVRVQQSVGTLRAHRLRLRDRLPFRRSRPFRPASTTRANFW